MTWPQQSPPLGTADVNGTLHDSLVHLRYMDGLRFSFLDEPERPIVSLQGRNSCLWMIASLVLPLAIPSSLDDLQGKLHLTIYAIFIKTLNWILLSLISTKSGNSLQHYKSCSCCRFVTQDDEEWGCLCSFHLHPTSCFCRTSCREYMLAVSHYQPCGTQRTPDYFEKSEKVDLGYRLNCSSFFELFS